MSSTIRQATAGDIPVLTNLLHELFAIEKDFDFNEDKQRRGIELIVESATTVVFIAENNGEVIGMSTGQLVISTAQGGPSLLVEDVVVTEDWRGKGVGEKLIDAVCNWSITFGTERFQLLADANNDKALGFYNKLGWNKTNLICLRKMHSNLG